MISTRMIRAAVVALGLATALYLPWLVMNLDLGAWYVAVPYLLATLLVVASVGLTAINNWHRSVPAAHFAERGAEPSVGVIITTAGEPAALVRATAQSVLTQDYPRDRLVLIVSDDAHASEMEAMTSLLADEFPAATVRYHRPPPRGSRTRRGEAKAGNLNSALRLLDALGVELVETRDADDLVGDPSFLRQCAGQLAADPKAAYVQTVKEAQVSPGDPFDNLQPHFFRGAMLARNAANAVFPCGSGLVWRRAALHDIGGFPAWNLVEDLQSGVEALRRGWRGIYLPIVGAVGQHAPEDLPNVYKQRGTWAVDTVRLMVFGELRGLRLRQRLHFLELAAFYFQSFATLGFIACAAAGLLFGVFPVETTYASYGLHLTPFVVATELLLAACAAGRSYETLWRARVLWTGLAFVYAKACVLALRGGRDRKPTYVVTRKHHDHRVHWRSALAPAAACALLVAAIGHAITTGSLLREVDLGTVFWSCFFLAPMAAFVRLSWFGVRLPRPRRAPRSAAVPRARARRASTTAAARRGPARYGAPAPHAPAIAPWVVLPTYNEAENVEAIVRAVLGSLRRVAPDGRLLIVDDNSPDGTGLIAARLAAELEGVEVLHRAGKEGLGRAYLAGFAHALAGGADVVVEMDADFSHDPRDVPRLLAASREAEVVLGSRWVPGGGVEGWPRHRLLLSRVGSWYARRVLGLGVRDLTGGFKCLRREVLERIDLEDVRSGGYVFQIEMTLRAARMGMRVREVPITFRERRAGHSKMSTRIALEAAWRVPALGVRALAGRLRTREALAPGAHHAAAPVAPAAPVPAAAAAAPAVPSA